MIGMVDLMEDYEAGCLAPRETLELYAELTVRAKPDPSLNLVDASHLS
jgi:hypothetical protein